MQVGDARTAIHTTQLKCHLGHNLCQLGKENKCVQNSLSTQVNGNSKIAKRKQAACLDASVRYHACVWQKGTCVGKASCNACIQTPVSHPTGSTSSLTHMRALYLCNSRSPCPTFSFPSSSSSSSPITCFPAASSPSLSS